MCEEKARGNLFVQFQSNSIHLCQSNSINLINVQLISDQIEERWLMLERLPSRKATQFVPCGCSDTQKKPLVFAAEDMLVIVIVIIIVILFVCSKYKVF